MRPAVVVVSHDSASSLPGLLATLAVQEPDVAVVVVDSGSQSGPPASEGFDVVPLDANVGYGAASNVGAARLLVAGADVLVLLNPDVRLAGPSLSELVSHLAPDIGIATGPIVDPQGERQPSAWGPTSPIRAFWFATGWRWPRLRGWMGRVRAGGAMTSAASLARDELEVDGHVLGGAMVVRRECWEQLGGFDEDFFLYWEDADLCQRARELGWKVAVLPCTPIVHVAGTSSAGVTSTQRWRWYVEGATRYADKHLTPWQKRRLLWALRIGRLLRRRM